MSCIQAPACKRRAVTPPIRASVHGNEEGSIDTIPADCKHHISEYLDKEDLFTLHCAISRDWQKAMKMAGWVGRTACMNYWKLLNKGKKARKLTDHLEGIVRRKYDGSWFRYYKSLFHPSRYVLHLPDSITTFMRTLVSAHNECLCRNFEQLSGGLSSLGTHINMEHEKFHGWGAHFGRSQPPRPLYHREGVKALAKIEFNRCTGKCEVKTGTARDGRDPEQYGPGFTRTDPPGGCKKFRDEKLYISRQEIMRRKLEVVIIEDPHPGYKLLIDAFAVFMRGNWRGGWESADRKKQREEGGRRYTSREFMMYVCTVGNTLSPFKRHGVWTREESCNAILTDGGVVKVVCEVGHNGHHVARFAVDSLRSYIKEYDL